MTDTVAEHRAILRPPTSLLVALTMIGPLTLNIFIPSMPSMARLFDSGTAVVQLTLTMYLVGMSIGQLIYGPLSDRYGRRPVMMVGIVGFIGSSFLVALSPTIESLIVARFLQALSGCTAMVLTRAIIMDVYGREGSASVLAYVTMAMAAAPALAPAIGGQLDVWFSWRASAWLLVAWGVLVYGLSRPWLHETNHSRIQHINVIGLAEIYVALLRSRVYLGYTFFNVFMSGSFFTFVGGAPYVVVDVMGGTPTDYGYYFVLVSIGFMSGSFVAGRLSTRLGVDRMIALGIASALLGCAALFVTTVSIPITLPGLFLPITLISAGSGIAMPNAISGAVGVNPQAAGSASGLLGFLQMTVASVLTVLVAWLIANWASHLPLIIMITVTCLLALCCFLGARRASRSLRF